MKLKIGVAILITAINISVYCIWVPARLQVSAKYEYINNIWDRCEKVIYLLVDAALNWYFIRIVQKKLVDQGCKRFLELFLPSKHICFQWSARYGPMLFLFKSFPHPLASLIRNC